VSEFRLETERLVLRDWRDSDFEALHALCTCPQVMATIGPLHDEDKTRGLLARLQERTARDGHTFCAGAR
jgi:RimJ/RimL family protein N-acetyltransferase